MVLEIHLIIVSKGIKIRITLKQEILQNNTSYENLRNKYPSISFRIFNKDNGG